MPSHQLSNQTRFWLVIAALFVVALWALRPMLLPFVAGMTIAYFLNPVVNTMTKIRVPRWGGTLITLVGFIMLVVLLLLLLAPLLQGQVTALLTALPEYISSVRASLLPWIEKIMEHVSPQDMEKIRTAVENYAGQAVVWGGQVFKQVISGGFAIFDVLTLLVITPVVAFYLLRDWPRITAAIDALLPLRYRPTIRQEMDNIDRTLSGFVRGQALVCLSLGLIYGIGLTLTGLQYGATIGIVAGVLSFIPYVGSTFVLITGTGLGLLQFDESWRVGMILLVFLVGQSLEGYVLTPKLVGDRVGLHPVWILFALFAGGSLLGFAGVLIAVPVAAVIGVLVRFAIGHYRRSGIYQKVE